MVTTCDFLINFISAAGGMESFLAVPTNTENVLHFTDHDERDIYAAVDVDQNSELRQDGKVVVITGAGRGIGRGIATMFAKAKAQAIGICARTTSELEETKREILDTDPDCKVYLQQVDVTHENEVKSFFDAICEAYGKVDICISNAGAASGFKPVEQSETDAWWNDVTINLKGTYLVSKFFLQVLGGTTGTLINISSLNALAVLPGPSAYNVSKLASARLIESLHLEAPNLRTFSIHPGSVDTEMIRSTARQIGTELKWAWTTPALVGATILWLTTAESEFLRGRWISTNWPVNELDAKKEEILRNNLLKTAFHADLGI